MATKQISGAYPAGYYLKPTYQNLVIDPTGVISGPGITTTAAHPSNIDNQGRFLYSIFPGPDLTTNGISLSDGGTITNGSPTNRTAMIADDGAPAIVVNNAAGTLTNYAGITNAAVWTGDGYDFAVSVLLNAGGVVTNTAGAFIQSGISVAGGSGTITNSGILTRGPNSHGDTFRADYAVVLTAGGQVTNGRYDPNTQDGVIAQGIFISGSAGAVINDGKITGPRYFFQYGVWQYGPSIRLATGGTITNGSASNSAADITNGIVLSGPGTVTNFGTIADRSGKAVSFDSPGASLILEGTGVLQGKADGGGGRLKLDGQAGPGTLTGLGSSITNFASISIAPGASWTLNGANTIAAGVVLDNSGTTKVASDIINSGKILNRTNAKLSFGADASITLASAALGGSFVNAGTIEKAGGTGASYIRTGSASLLDTGSIVVKSGTLALSGETVRIGGAITGAGTIKFARGALMNVNLGPGTSIATAGLTISGSDTHVTLATNLNYAHAFTATGGSELMIRGGNLFSLTGTASFTQVTVDGAGQLQTKGATTLSGATLGGKVEWQNTGVLTETGQLTIGDASRYRALFTNEAGGVFNITGNWGIGIGSVATSTFANAGLLEKTAGAPSKIAVPVANTGTVEAAHGTLDLQNKVTGIGTLTIDGGAILQADNAVGSSQTTVFSGTNARLKLTDAAHFLGKLFGFDANDKLDLTQFGAGTTISYAGNAASGKLTVRNGALHATIAFLGDYAASGFHAGSDGHGGTLVTYSPPAAPLLAASGNLDEKRSFAGVDRGKLSDFAMGSDDALAARIGLLRQYMSAEFHATSDGHGGTFVAHTPPADNLVPHIAATHA